MLLRLVLQNSLRSYTGNCLPCHHTFKKKIICKGLQNLILNWLNYRIELSVSRCLIRFQVRCSLIRVFLKTVSLTHMLGLLWKVLKEGYIICCQYVLHTNISTAVNIEIIIVEIHIAFTVLLVLQLFVHLNNDYLGRYSKVQCHLAQFI